MKARELPHTAFVPVAGGQGERLGYQVRLFLSCYVCMCLCALV